MLEFIMIRLSTILWFRNCMGIHILFMRLPISSTYNTIQNVTVIATTKINIGMRRMILNYCRGVKRGTPNPFLQRRPQVRWRPETQ